jgi:hypothetical protein
MSTSYSFTKTISDTFRFYNYIFRTFNTITDVAANPPDLLITFSAALSAPNQTLLGSLVTSYIDVTEPLASNVYKVLAVTNSTNIPLTSASVYTGQWDEVGESNSLYISVKADVASAVDGLQIQYGIIAKTADITRSYSVLASSPQSIMDVPKGRFFRVVYTNGASGQTTFTLACFIAGSAIHPITTSNEIFNDTNSAVLSRSLLSGRMHAGNYRPLCVTSSGTLERNTHDYPQSDSERQMVQVDFSHGVHPDVNVTTLTSGTVTASSGRAVVATGAAINTNATLRSYYYSACSGFGKIVFRCGAAFTTGATGSTQLIGIGDTTDGLFIGYNAAAFGVCVRAATVDTWVAQTAFNIDKLDGTGPSGITLSPTSGNVYAIMYDASGYGDVSYWIRRPITSSFTYQGAAGWLEMHRTSFGNTGANTAYMTRYHLPCYVYAGNTTSATLKSIYVTFYQTVKFGSIITNVPDIVRSFDTSDSITSLTPYPMLTLQNLATVNSIPNDKSIKLIGFNIGMSGTSRTTVIVLFRDATLTTAAYLPATSTTYITQTDIAATAVSGGTQIYSAPFFAGSGYCDLKDLDILIPPGGRITVAAKLLPSTGTVPTTLSLVWAEF